MLAWWTKEPNANIGIPTGRRSRLLVLDVDQKYGGPLALAEWLSANDLGIAVTALAITGGGGQHTFFLHPDDREYPSLPQGHFLGIKGVEVKGDGGYIVAAPSVHESGAVYTWKDGLDKLIPAPPWFLAAWDNSRPSRTPPSREAVPARIQEGERNSTLFTLAASLRAKGLTRKTIFIALSEANERCEPPLDVKELENIAANVSNRYVAGDPAANGHAVAPPPTEQHLTDVGNALMLQRLRGESIRFADDMEQWFFWNEKHWEPASEAVMLDIASSVARERHSVARNMPEDQRSAYGKYAYSCEAVQKRKSMIEAATALGALRVRAQAFDANPRVFYAQNRAIELTKRGIVVRKHLREDLVTKIGGCDYDPSARRDRFDKFMMEFTGGNQELIDYLQRLCGYLLTGLTHEQAMFMFFGGGSNGKRKFLEAITNVLGGYAVSVQFETFSAKERNASAPSPDLAKMRGARVVSATEPEQGVKLGEALVKQLTGEDPVTAREMYDSPFTFIPTHKIIIATNYKPVIRGTDFGIWRRVKLVPCLEQFDDEKGNKDPLLAEKLKAEASGVLNWMLAGFTKFQETGLAQCVAVTAATAEYRSESDVIGVFVAECVIRKSGCELTARELYSRYATWCREAGEYQHSQTAFGRKLAERGFEKLHKTTGWWYQGVTFAYMTG